MVAERIRKFLAESLNALGLGLAQDTSRDSLVGVLRQAKSAGLSPRTVVDVGAACGSFSLACWGVFPDAKYVLIEPLEEHRPVLEVVTRSIPGAEFILAAATSEPGEVTINVHTDLVGSSLYLEGEDTDVNGVPRTVPVITLDSLTENKQRESPFLVKVDVQGAELDVLLGAERVLLETEYIILEVSLFEFFVGGPQFYDVVAFMKSRGFVLFDILGLQYRPLDGALSQLDTIFVRDDSLLRQRHFYATQEQRDTENQKFESIRRRLLARHGL